MSMIIRFFFHSQSIFVNNNEYVRSHLTILRENFDFNQQTKLNHMFLSLRQLTMTSDIRQLTTTSDY